MERKKGTKNQAIQARLKKKIRDCDVDRDMYLPPRRPPRQKRPPELVIVSQGSQEVRAPPEGRQARSMKYEFAPNFTVSNRLPGVASIADLEKERGVYSATPEFVRKHCGDIAKAFLDAVPSWYYEEAEKLKLFPNVDVRIHRLYYGDVPAYPGWHCDGEFRETYFSQPDLDKIKVSRHLTGTVSSVEGGVSNTQFLCNSFTAEIERPPSQEISLWSQVNRQVEAMRSKTVYDTKDGELILFDARTLHRAMPAKVRGWRLFFRMSMWHRPNLGDGGMLTKQEQVYKFIEEGVGW